MLHRDTCLLCIEASGAHLSKSGSESLPTFLNQLTLADEFFTFCCSNVNNKVTRALPLELSTTKLAREVAPHASKLATVCTTINSKDVSRSQKHFLILSYNRGTLSKELLYDSRSNVVRQRLNIVCSIYFRKYLERTAGVKEAIGSAGLLIYRTPGVLVYIYSYIYYAQYVECDVKYRVYLLYLC